MKAQTTKFQRSVKISISFILSFQIRWNSDIRTQLKKITLLAWSRGFLQLVENVSIPTYIINLPRRNDRLQHITNEFKGRPEFDIMMFATCEHPNRAVSLLISIKKIVEIAMKNDDDVIIICEDDHQFTHQYSKTVFLESIVGASMTGTNLISGGVGIIEQVVPVSERLFWTNAIWHIQFIVLFKNVFQDILDEPLDNIVDGKDIFMQVTSHKMLLAPFISTKKDFGDPTYNSLPNQRPVVEQFAYAIGRPGTICKKRSEIAHS